MCLSTRGKLYSCAGERLNQLCTFLVYGNEGIIHNYRSSLVLLPGRLCFWSCLVVCLFVCLSIGLPKK